MTERGSRAITNIQLKLILNLMFIKRTYHYLVWPEHLWPLHVKQFAVKCTGHIQSLVK